MYSARYNQDGQEKSLADPYAPRVEASDLALTLETGTSRGILAFWAPSRTYQGPYIEPIRSAGARRTYLRGANALVASVHNDHDGVIITLRTTRAVPTYDLQPAIYNCVAMAPREDSVFAAAQRGTVGHFFTGMVPFPASFADMDDTTLDDYVASGEYFRPIVARLAMLSLTHSLVPYNRNINPLPLTSFYTDLTSRPKDNRAQITPGGPEFRRIYGERTIESSGIAPYCVYVGAAADPRVLSLLSVICRHGGPVRGSPPGLFSVFDDYAERVVCVGEFSASSVGLPGVEPEYLAQTIDATMRLLMDKNNVPPSMFAQEMEHIFSNLPVLNVNFLERCKLSVDVGMGYDPRRAVFGDRAGNNFPRRREGPPGDPHRAAMLGLLNGPNGLFPDGSGASSLMTDDLKLDMFSAATEEVGLPRPANGGLDVVIGRARALNPATVTMLLNCSIDDGVLGQNNEVHMLRLANVWHCAHYNENYGNNFNAANPPAIAPAGGDLTNLTQNAFDNIGANVLAGTSHFAVIGLVDPGAAVAPGGNGAAAGVDPNNVGHTPLAAIPGILGPLPQGVARGFGGTAQERWRLTELEGMGVDRPSPGTYLCSGPDAADVPAGNFVAGEEPLSMNNAPWLMRRLFYSDRVGDGLKNVAAGTDWTLWEAAYIRDPALLVHYNNYLVVDLTPLDLQARVNAPPPLPRNWGRSYELNWNGNLATPATGNALINALENQANMPGAGAVLAHDEDIFGDFFTSNGGVAWWRGLTAQMRAMALVNVIAIIVMASRKGHPDTRALANWRLAMREEGHLTSVPDEYILPLIGKFHSYAMRPMGGPWILGLIKRAGYPRPTNEQFRFTVPDSAQQGFFSTVLTVRAQADNALQWLRQAPVLEEGFHCDEVTTFSPTGGVVLSLTRNDHGGTPAVMRQRSRVAMSALLMDALLAGDMCPLATRLIDRPTTYEGMLLRRPRAGFGQIRADILTCFVPTVLSGLGVSESTGVWHPSNVVISDEMRRIIRQPGALDSAAGPDVAKWASDPLSRGASPFFDGYMDTLELFMLEQSQCFEVTAWRLPNSGNSKLHRFPTLLNCGGRRVGRSEFSLVLPFVAQPLEVGLVERDAAYNAGNESFVPLPLPAGQVIANERARRAALSAGEFNQRSVNAGNGPVPAVVTLELQRRTRIAESSPDVWRLTMPGLIATRFNLRFDGNPIRYAPARSAHITSVVLERQYAGFDNANIMPCLHDALRALTLPPVEEGGLGAAGVPPGSQPKLTVEGQINEPGNPAVEQPDPAQNALIDGISQQTLDVLGKLTVNQLLAMQASGALSSSTGPPSSAVFSLPAGLDTSVSEAVHAEAATLHAETVSGASSGAPAAPTNVGGSSAESVDSILAQLAQALKNNARAADFGRE